MRSYYTMHNDAYECMNREFMQRVGNVGSKLYVIGNSEISKHI